MDADNLVVVLGIATLPVVGSMRGLVAAFANFLQPLRMFLLQRRSLLQKGGEFLFYVVSASFLLEEMSEVSN